ncbi:FtsK/SpoIIIE domain-containing protein [Photobacterium sanguinicancri]|uniref:FtsK/SpoIIIE domain-containing protein n=1 Tax=Photobacterium sanguinicancri TaxID=875932 RepID=UPI00247FB4C8|nr:FtsK/SpoIIIE domain-containing protein [Photobacterium sanguinicancri]
MFTQKEIEKSLEAKSGKNGEAYVSWDALKEQAVSANRTFCDTKGQWLTSYDELANCASSHAESLPQYCDDLLIRLSEQELASCASLRYALEALPVPLQAELCKVDWSGYTFDEQLMPYDVVVGYQGLALPDGRKVNIPAMMPFLSTSNCFVIGNRGNDDAINEVHKLVIRLNATMPYTSQFSLLDPANGGKSFLYNKNIPYKRMIEKDICKVLEEIEDDALRIRQTFLDQTTQRLHDVDETIRSNERFEFIVAANFPSGYDRRAIELLASIANNATDTGKYVILHLDNEQNYPNGTSLDMFKSRYNVVAQRQVVDQLSTTNDSETNYSEKLTDDVITRFFDSLSQAKPQERKLAFTDVVSTVNADMWQGDASNELRSAIGGSGSKMNDLEIWFGESKDGRSSSHGMLGATTGAGKSYLYHAFIMGLACQYSPEELEFYLIDGKQGVEFQSYSDLPHAKVVSLKTSPQLARSVVDELTQEMERRNELFQRLGVTNFGGYREAGSPEGKLPRIMLIVDEYQVLFEDDRDGVGSELMYKLAAQARSAGIHMFVGSQRFGAPGMQKQQHIFGNIHLRVGMKMTSADVTSLQEFGHNGKRLLRACKEPGQAVVNDGAGDDERNVAGRVAFLDNDSRSALIQQLAQKWQQHKALDCLHKAILLDGSGQPELRHNPQLAQLLNHASRPSEQAWTQFANTSPHLGGLGEKEWYTVESPAVFWLGQELNIHGHANVILRRRPHEHILITGESNEARLGMMSAALAQLSLNFSPDRYEAVVYERSIKGSPWHGAMSCSVPQQSAVTVLEKAREFEEKITEVHETLEQRRGLYEDEVGELPSIFIFCNDFQRATELQMKAGKFGVNEPSDTAKKLIQILDAGAEFGIHLVIASDSVRALQKVFNRHDIDNVRHKVALQMSEDDSFSLLKVRSASQLQVDGKNPVNALYVDHTQNRPNHFKPYFFNDIDDHKAKMDHLFNRMSDWE